jgi:hypothetical protein
MAGTTFTYRTYPFTDFPNHVVNPSILQTEIGNYSPTITQPVSSITLGGTTCTIIMNGLLVAADITGLDTVVADHQGSVFSSQTQRANSEAQSSSDLTTDTAKVSLSTGPLPAGYYSATWYAEIACTGIVANTGVSAGFTIQKNGGTVTEIGRSANNLSTYVSFSGSYSAQLVSGDSLVMAINFKRLGSTSNPALIQRARIFLNPQGS